MTPVEAAARLGVHESQVTGVREHPLGHVVSLRKGHDMLVTATVARAYLPDVDDEPEGGFVEPGQSFIVGEPQASTAEPAPKKPAKKTAPKA